MWRSSDTNDSEHEIPRGSLAGKGERRGRGPPTDTEAHSNAAVGKCAISSRQCKAERESWQAILHRILCGRIQIEWHKDKIIRI